MAEKKMTKKECFALIREIVKDNAELVAFVDHEVELLNRKNSNSSQTKTQKENAVISEMLLTEITKIAKPVTISDLMATSDAVKEYVLEDGRHLSNQKISALLNKMVKDETLVKVIDKKKSYFSLAE